MELSWAESTWEMIHKLTNNRHQQKQKTIIQLFIFTVYSLVLQSQTSADQTGNFTLSHAVSPPWQIALSACSDWTSFVRKLMTLPLWLIVDECSTLIINFPQVIRDRAERRLTGLAFHYDTKAFIESRWRGISWAIRAKGTVTNQQQTAAALP